MESQPFRACFCSACFWCLAARFSLTLRPGFFDSADGRDFSAMAPAYDSEGAVAATDARPGATFRRMPTPPADLPTSRDLRGRREAVVREHMASENESRFDDTLATFTHPRYELIGTGQVYDGDRRGEGVLRPLPVGVPRPAQRGARHPQRAGHRRRRVRPPRHPPRLAHGRGAHGQVVPVPDGGAVRIRDAMARASCASASTSTPRPSTASCAPSD